MYDLIIIGSGPAGLTASIYAARYRLNLLVISLSRGGLAATAHKVCNYPSYKEINGFELMNKFIEHANSLEVPIKYEGILEITGKDNEFLVKTTKNEYKTKKVLYAGGTERNKLNVKNEKELTGKGVSYCATCDAAFFKDKIVAVVGGSDAALTSALLLSEYCEKVYIVYRKDKFYRAEPSWVKLVEENEKIDSFFNEEISEIIGEKSVEGVMLKSGELKVQGVFIEIGSYPHTDILDSLNISKNNKGYIITDKSQKTNVKGLFAAGDATNNDLKQIITACGEGATAVYNAYKEIKQND